MGVDHSGRMAAAPVPPELGAGSDYFVDHLAPGAFRTDPHAFGAPPRGR
jgi:hypothetical protein